ncbi:DUF6087 family protein [Streptomyces sp. NPDC057412]|uniref:DUF6087 family protein n=1 Tax=Streptomyces sp. NPDC057412 TaxID=3346123 RepID=UPI00367AC0F1
MTPPAPVGPAPAGAVNREQLAAPRTRPAPVPRPAARPPQRCDGPLVSDLAAAKTVLYPPQPAEQKPAEWDRPALGKGRGRHRKPTTADEREQ